MIQLPDYLWVLLQCDTPTFKPSSDKIFKEGHSSTVNAIGIVLAPPLFRDMEMTWMSYETHTMCQVSLCRDEETAVVERKNGSSRILKVKPFLWVHFC